MRFIIPCVAGDARRAALRAGLALALGAVFGLSGTGQEPAKPAAADPPLLDAQGYRQLLGRHQGKPLMVSFWATWCEPCRDEYPMVNELARQHAPEGLVVLGISLDDDAEMNLVRHFLAQMKPIFPNYRKRPGNDEAFINSVSPKWSGALPATFFYRSDGQLVAQLIGEHTRAAFEKAIAEVLRASRKKPAVSHR